MLRLQRSHPRQGDRILRDMQERAAMGDGMKTIKTRPVRRKGWYVEVQAKDVSSGKLFFAMKAGYTTLKEAREDMANRAAAGNVARITDMHGEVVE